MISAEGNDPGYSPLSFNFGTEWREPARTTRVRNWRAPEDFMDFSLEMAFAYLGGELPQMHVCIVFICVHRLC